MPGAPTAVLPPRLTAVVPANETQQAISGTSDKPGSAPLICTIDHHEVLREPCQHLPRTRSIHMDRKCRCDAETAKVVRLKHCSAASSNSCCSLCRKVTRISAAPVEPLDECIHQIDENRNCVPLRSSADSVARRRQRHSGSVDRSVAAASKYYYYYYYYYYSVRFDSGQLRL